MIYISFLASSVFAGVKYCMGWRSDSRKLLLHFAIADHKLHFSAVGDRLVKIPYFSQYDPSRFRYVLPPPMQRLTP
jgi:hypothetical protein